MDALRAIRAGMFGWTPAMDEAHNFFIENMHADPSSTVPSLG